MKLRRVLLFLVSVAIAALLIGVLIRLGKVDLRLTLQQLEHAKLISVIIMVLFNCLLVYLSTVKWRLVDAALRSSEDAVPSQITSFFITSVGMALGLIVPMQIAMAIARTFGTHSYGKSIKRGTAGTVFEQSFDLLIVLFLSVASWVTWTFSGGGLLWISIALIMVVIALLTMSPIIHITKLLFRSASRTCKPESDVDAIKNQSSIIGSRHPIKTLTAKSLHYFLQIEHSGLLNASLARRLMLLSATRFAVIVLLANQTALAVNAQIQLWHIAAAMPFVSIANVLGITPGGVGVNELTIVSMLHLFGTPLSIASQWAVDYRLLCTLSYFVVAAIALLLFWSNNVLSHRTSAVSTNNMQ